MTLDSLIALRDGARERALATLQESATPLDVEALRAADNVQVRSTGLMIVTGGELDLTGVQITTGAIDVRNGATVIVGQTHFKDTRLAIKDGANIRCEGPTLFTQSEMPGRKPASFEFFGDGDQRYISDFTFADQRKDSIKAHGVADLDRFFFEITLPLLKAHGDAIQTTGKADFRISNSVCDLRKDHRLFSPGIQRGPYNVPFFIQYGRAQIENCAVWTDSDAKTDAAKVGMSITGPTGYLEASRLYYDARRPLGGHKGARVADIVDLTTMQDTTAEQIEKGARLWRWGPSLQSTAELARLRAELQEKEANIQAAVDDLRAALS